MTQYLPLKNFRWLEESEFSKIDWNKVDDHSSIGYFLEVDLYYPENLHDLHSDLPCCPEKNFIEEKYLSDFQKNVLASLRLNNYDRTKTEKLVLTLSDKKKYVLHYRNLKLYLKLGLKLTKVYKVLSFYQTNWLEKYILLNTKLRESCNNQFEQDLYKLMNNAIFGKSCENVRNHLNLKLALNQFQAKNIIKRTFFKDFKIIDQNKVLFRMKKQSVTLNKPIFLGFTVLELSKLHMYDTHYNVFKNFYSDRCKLAYMDTDSFIYEIETLDLYKDFNKHFKNYLDTSNYPINHFLFSNTNKKKLGYFKDEMSGEPIDEFIGLKPKLYSMRFKNKKSNSKCKGIQKVVLNKFITHKHFRKVLKGDRLIYSEIRMIKSKKFVLSTIKQNKLALSPFDDKRYIKNNLIDTLPFGHKSIS